MTKVFNTPDERHYLLQRMGDALRAHPLVSVGFGLYWMWTILLFQSPALLSGESPLASLGLPSETVILIGSIVAYLIWACGFRRMNALSKMRFFAAYLVLTLLLGILICMVCAHIVSNQVLFRTVLYATGSFLIGLGTASFCLEFGRLFRYLGPQQVLFYGTFALFGGSALALILTLFSTTAESIALFITPFPMVYCLRQSMRAVPAKELYNQGMQSPLYVPPGFLLVSLIQGLALGAMYLPLSLSPALQGFPLNLGAFALGTVLLFLTGLWVKMAFNHLVFRVGIPLMALGFFVISLGTVFLPLGIAVLNMGYCYLYLIMCCLCSYLARAHKQSPLWIVGTGTACLLIGQLAGELLTLLPVQRMELLVGGMAFGLVLVALYMTSGDIAYGWGRVRPGADEFLSDALATTCKILTDEYALSRREAEVLALLVRGRTRKSISEQLDVSEETVKSHTSNIYNKLLIHSRTELLDLVEQRASSLN